MNDDPVFDELLRAHKKEAGRLGVEFTNFGWGTDQNKGHIESKTTKGVLVSDIDENTMQVSHSWFAWEEYSRDEQQIRSKVEQFAKNVPGYVRGYVMRHLEQLRDVYADMAEFAPVWDAIDKIEKIGRCNEKKAEKTL
jgi:hypothetical protein